MATSLTVTNSTPFWFPPTATIDWCEPNYTHSPYVVEWWNTWSNLAYVVLGGYEFMARVPRRTYGSQLLALLLCIVGASSAAFHGTLKLHAQLTDEIAMNLFIGLLNFMLHPNLTLCLYTLVFAAMHAHWHFTTLFQIQFLVQVIWTFILLRKHNLGGKRFLRCCAPISLGFSFWCTDYLMCASLGHWGGHGWWHVLTALSGWQTIGAVRMRMLPK